MLQRVLSLGLALIFGNWFQTAALVTHDCQNAPHPRAATNAAESTPAVEPTHSAKAQHDCCPHPATEALTAHGNNVGEMICGSRSMNCCELHTPLPEGAVPVPESVAMRSHRAKISIDGPQLPSASGDHVSVSNPARDSIPSSQTTSLRL